MDRSLNRVTSRYPGRKPALDWFSVREPCLPKNLRRTGAGLFLRSSAVGYDLVIAAKLIVTLGDLFYGNGDSSDYMDPLIFFL